MRAVREAAGPDIGVRLDANQGWSREDAVAVIRALAEADLGVEIVEQPVAGDDVEGLAWVRERVDLPIMADAAYCSMRSQDGITVRVWQGSDIRNDELLMRIDILYGYAVLRPEWACRINCT